MLVLSRKQGQALVIDGKILVRVLRVRGGKVCLGIDAPAVVSVRREEICESPAVATRETKAVA